MERGVSALWFGLRFLGGRRDLWTLAAVPMVLTLLLGSLGLVGGGYGGYALAGRFFGSGSGHGLGELVITVLRILAALVGGGVGAMIGASLAVPCAGPALESIARAARESLGLPPAVAMGLAGIGHSLAGVVLSWVVGIFGIGVLSLIGMVLPPALLITLPLKAVIVALLLCLDLADPAFSLAGYPLGQRLGWLRAHAAAACGFGFAAGALLLVPVVGLLVLPAAVAGATRLVASEPETPPGQRP